MNESNTWETTDLGIAASLMSVGYTLLDVDMGNTKRAKFIFEDDGTAENSAARYWGSDLEVNARTMVDNQKYLKHRIYNHVTIN